MINVVLANSIYLIFLGEIMGSRHKVFISYHHANDQCYKDEFIRLFSYYANAIVDRSVSEGDIDPYLNTETIRQKIRDNNLRDSSVTIVLVGKETWKRKHVDWEISSSIRDTRFNSRSGLIGILLPTHPDYGKSNYNHYTIPPRLYDNIKCGFAKLYDWTDNASKIQEWVHEAYLRRTKVNPDNSRAMFGRNRSGDSWSD